MVDDTGMWSANVFGRADLLVRWSSLDRTKDESGSESSIQDWTKAAMERVHGSAFLQRQANTKKKLTNNSKGWRCKIASETW
jgi:hypothetical protein